LMDDSCSISVAPMTPSVTTFVVILAAVAPIFLPALAARDRNRR
jgi:hypothetical protein